jgi:hypothetical protein
MKKNNRKSPVTTILLFCVFAFAITGTVFLARRNRAGVDLAPASMYEPLATPSLSREFPTTSPSSLPTQYITTTPTTDEVGTAYAVIAKDKATSTAESAKTSTAYAIAETQSAHGTQAFWVDVTLAVGTEFATQTQVAQTQAAGTNQAAWQTAAPATATVIKATQIVEADALNSKRVSVWMTNVGGTFVFLVFLGVLVFGLYKFILWGEERGKAVILKQKAEAMKPDANGRHPLITSGSLMSGEKLLNPNLMHRAALDPTVDDLDDEQALRNVQSARNLEGVRILAPQAGKLTSDMAKQMRDSAMSASGIKITNPETPAETIVSLPVSNRITALALPEWSTLANNWDGKKLPYGVGSRGLLTADPAEDPHLLIVGRTRTGKSRYGLRTVAASALTMGYQVLFIGKRVDFYPFENHANAKIVGVDLLNEPQKYLEVLRRVAGLMKERDDYLTNKRMSIWQQTGQPQLYVVLDEFSSAVRQLNAVKTGMGNTVSSIATALIQEGGKYGINIIQVVQDATGANVDISARRNMGRMVFRLSEPKASEIALGVRDPSATDLPSRHFFSTFGDGSADITLGAAFAPTDDEIQAFLLDRPAVAQEPMSWVDGSTIAEEKPQMPQSVSSDEETDIEEKIAAEWMTMRDAHKWSGWNGLERAVFGEVKNGARSVKIKRVVASLQGVDVADVNAEIDRLVASWDTTRSATFTTTHKNEDFQPIFAA